MSNDEPNPPRVLLRPGRCCLNRCLVRRLPAGLGVALVVGMAACGFGEGLVGGGFEVYRDGRFGDVVGVFDLDAQRMQGGKPAAQWISSLGSSAYPSAGFLTEEVIRNAGAFGIADPAHDLAPTGAYRDSLGMGHLRYEQRYNGVPVFGGELTAHYLASGELSSITGRTLGVGESATTGIAGGMRKAPKRGL